MASESPRFARIPEHILNDETLTLTDFKVFARMAILCIDTNIVTIGERKLAELTGIDRRNLRRSLERLGKKGYISRAIGLFSGRAVYQLNSPVFLATSEKRAARPFAGASIHILQGKKKS